MKSFSGRRCVTRFRPLRNGVGARERLVNRSAAGAPWCRPSRPRGATAGSPRRRRPEAVRQNARRCNAFGSCCCPPAPGPRRILPPTLICRIKRAGPGYPHRVPRSSAPFRRDPRRPGLSPASLPRSGGSGGPFAVASISPPSPAAAVATNCHPTASGVGSLMTWVLHPSFWCCLCSCLHVFLTII